MQSCGLAFSPASLSGLCKAAWKRRASHLAEHQQWGKLLCWAYLNANNKGQAKLEEARPLCSRTSFPPSPEGHGESAQNHKGPGCGSQSQKTQEDLSGCSGTLRFDVRDATVSGLWRCIGQWAVLGTPLRNQLHLQASPDIIWRKHNSLYQKQSSIKLKWCHSSVAASGRDWCWGGIISPAALDHSTASEETDISQGPFRLLLGCQTIREEHPLEVPSLPVTAQGAPATSPDKTCTCRRAQLRHDESWCGSPAKVQVLHN